MEAVDSMDPNPMADMIGPFYTPDTVAARLGCRVRDLDERDQTGELLGLRTSDGAQVYPVFQFTLTGTVRPELVPVLTILTGVPRWSAAVWLRTPNTGLNEHSPEGWLGAGGDPALVRNLVGHWAGTLSA